MNSLAPPSEDQVLSISDLTSQITGTLRMHFPEVWVAGEVSNFSQSGAGHAYLTLKDDKAQIRAVIWRGTMATIPFDVADGLDVIALGSIDVYASRGQYQLTIRQLLPRGIGPLELAFRQLRDKLEREGLFDPEHKRPIPSFPRRVMLVTSPRSAAIRDFLEVAGRRWQGSDIIVCPCAVQGDAAIGEILHALELAQQVQGADVIALIRGGGSLEDFAAFNSEEVARAVYASRLPVVCGVGHEIDISIADLVADLRALTPSEAAERIFPDGHALRTQLGPWGDRLLGAIIRQIERNRHHVNVLNETKTFKFPLDRWQEQSRRLDECESDLVHKVRDRLAKEQNRFAMIAKQLDSLSPLSTLARGYALVSRDSDGGLVTKPEDVNVEDRVMVRLSRGKIVCRVEGVEGVHGT